MVPNQFALLDPQDLPEVQEERACVDPEVHLELLDPLAFREQPDLKVVKDLKDLKDLLEPRDYRDPSEALVPLDPRALLAPPDPKEPMDQLDQWDQPDHADPREILVVVEMLEWPPTMLFC
jgi:hypothetical protein